MKFVMFDIEALGPPGVGEIFALGAVRFDPDTGRILDRFSRNVRPGSGLGGDLRATCDTLRWALAQSPSVLDQLRDPMSKPFSAVYFEFMAWLGLDDAIAGPIMLMADDWSDFAWIEFEALRAGLGGLRRDGIEMYDVSVLARVEPKERIRPERGLIKHVALDDAEAGALDFCARWPLIADRWIYPF